MDAQMKRGFLEACVLAALSRGESYGYQIIKDVPSTLGLTESTLYPLLKRLEGAGCIAVRSAEHNGRLRKYYRITKQGRTRVTAFIEEWNEVETIYRFVSEAAERKPERCASGEGVSIKTVEDAVLTAAKKTASREATASKKKTATPSLSNQTPQSAAPCSRQVCKTEGAAL